MWILLAGACTVTPPPDPTDDTPTAETGAPTEPPTETADTGEPPAPVPCPEGLDGPHADTATGCVVGRTVDGVEGFLGIPYAEPPTGERRWARPAPIAPWTEPREATDRGAVCIQSNGTVDGELAPGEGAEDCLTLHVLRPEGTVGGDDLPVMVFVHGGGHSDGAGAQASHVGESFARPTDDPPLLPDVPDLARRAIVVTVEYRLAQLGWLSLPALGDETGDGASGNQGLWDVLLALQWVHDSARSLGGDPDRTLLFGESAGAVSVCTLLATPAAEGLFSAAIAQSGTCDHIDRGPASAPEGEEPAYDQGARLAATLGCDSGSDAEVLSCLRALPAEQIMSVMTARQGLLGEGEVYEPVVDGVLLPSPPGERLRSGDFARVPVVFGANEDEGTLFAALAPISSPAVLELTLRAAALAAGWDADGLVALYDPADYGGDVSAAWAAFIGDSAFVCPARSALDAVAPWTEARAYWFIQDDWLIDSLGAYHGAEIGYVFGTGFRPEALQPLSEVMGRAWASVADGAPAIDGVGPWPLFGALAPDGGTWAQFGSPTEPIGGPRKAQCDWMDAQRGP